MPTAAPPLVAVVMGSASDWPTMHKAVEVLDRFGVAHEAQVVSAHRMPDEMFALRRVGRRPRACGRSSPAPAGPPTCPACWRRRPPSRCSACPCRRATSRARTRCCRSSRCPPAFPSPPSPSARPERRTPALFAVALLANDDPALRAALDAYRAERRAQAAASRPRRPAADVSIGLGRSPRRRRSACSAAASSGATPSIAARLAGYRTIVLDPDPAAPAGAVADRHLVAAYDDPAALDELATRCAVVTTEFENPPAEALQRLARDVVVAPPARRRGDRPGPHRREVVPRRAPDFPSRPFVALDRRCRPRRRWRARRCRRSSRPPGSATTARANVPVSDPAGVAAAWDELGRVPCIVERRLSLDARSQRRPRPPAPTAATATYPVAENVHRRRHPRSHRRAGTGRSGDRRRGTAPRVRRSPRPSTTSGVLAVELFVSDGQLLVNELAPRPHNSGHWTLDAAATSQFAQQIRAITGAALGAHVDDVTGGGDGQPARRPVVSRRTPASPSNRLGAVLADPTARLHLYGKAAPRPGRKMGHLTVLGDSADEVADASADAARRRRSEIERTAQTPVAATMDRCRTRPNGSTFRPSASCCAGTSPTTSTPCRP